MGRWAVFSVLVALGLPAGAEPVVPAPSAFDLLERLRETYAGLESYRDLGEIETRAQGEGADRSTVSYFETATVGDRFMWRVHGETPDGFEERIVWREGREAFVYTSRYRQHKPIPSVAAELAHGLGAGGYEALIVPLLLAGAEDVLSEPEAASVSGPFPCGAASCWALTLSRMSGTIETELEIDCETLMIRTVEVRLSEPPPTRDDPDLRGRDQRAATPGNTILEVRHQRDEGIPATFGPPPGSRRVSAWQPAEEIADDDDAAEQLEAAFSEEITVALYTIPLRIVDSKGEPIRDLEPQDLIVEIGSERVPILSLDFSSSNRSTMAVASRERAPARAPGLTTLSQPEPPAGRLIVFFLQVDLEPSRIQGHLKLLPDLEDLLDSLHPNDRVAVVSFDSHLKLWQDATLERGAAFDALTRAISHGTPPARRSSRGSLAEHFDFRAAADVANPEKALQLTAETLAALPGSKELVYVGWGLGRYGREGVRMTADYAPAVRALEAARTTVFVLDVSQADTHSLEVGLQNVAAHTGGSYERTFHFASRAVRRLARTISGFYEVTIDRSHLPAARGRLKISLRDKKGRILYKPAIFGWG